MQEAERCCHRNSGGPGSRAGHGRVGKSVSGAAGDDEVLVKAHPGSAHHRAAQKPPNQERHVAQAAGSSALSSADHSITKVILGYLTLSATCEYLFSS